MYIQYNRNNGNINGNIANALINIQYNGNNGRIGTTSGTISRNGTIQENQVNK